MKSDLFTRNLLIIIVTLLALNIILPTLSNPSTSYAAKNIEYKVDLCDGEDLEKLLNEYAKENWEPISINIMMVSMAVVVFKR